MCLDQPCWTSSSDDQLPEVPGPIWTRGSSVSLFVQVVLYMATAQTLCNHRQACMSCINSRFLAWPQMPVCWDDRSQCPEVTIESFVGQRSMGILCLLQFCTNEMTLTHTHTHIHLHTHTRTQATPQIIRQLDANMVRGALSRELKSNAVIRFVGTGVQGCRACA